jgi:hypothetical protein
MAKLDDRTIANMKAALDRACRSYPHDGDHETRKHIAQKLKRSADEGNITLGGLCVVAHSALEELRSQSRLKSIPEI